ncbi:formate/nitrite transporter family protein [Mollicutes bacterium LVI A0078]|nr:formate/nitrite transporter family protein [Mollicutes bacterium LVI A0075]WOO91566.1 formate/nitrite transporter family protein [Mollicutes bacterium LVI A0078]
MYNLAMEKVATAAVGKVKLYGSKGRYFVASMMAGAFVGLGILLIFSISGMLADSSAKSIVMGISFGIALSLVIMVGSELFTGNNFVMTIGSMNKSVKWKDTIETWVVCYIGNLVGALVVSAFFVMANVGMDNGAITALAGAATAKAAMPAGVLIFRGILCNILVCLAVFCSIKMENEVAKLIMIWWCLFAFITSSYEHSIANMTIYFTSILGGADVSALQMIYNLGFVTIGNMIGGILLGASYYYLGSKK